MNTLTEIKNAYAIEQGYEDWADLYRRSGYYDEKVFFMHEDVVIVLAEKAALEKAAESAMVQMDLVTDWYGVDRASITNPENLIQ